MLTKIGLAAALVLSGAAQAQAQDTAPGRPNILVIFGDDIGQTNIWPTATA